MLAILQQATDLHHHRRRAASADRHHLDAILSPAQQRLHVNFEMVVVRRESTLLVVSEKGMGKRSALGDYRVQKRGGKGIITLRRTEKTGSIVALKEVLPDDGLMMVTRNGVIIRVPVEGIRISGRNTQGVRVMNLDSGDTVMDVARVVEENEENGVEALGTESAAVVEESE